MDDTAICLIFHREILKHSRISIAVVRERVSILLRYWLATRRTAFCYGLIQ